MNLSVVIKVLANKSIIRHLCEPVKRNRTYLGNFAILTCAIRLEGSQWKVERKFNSGRRKFN